MSSLEKDEEQEGRDILKNSRNASPEILAATAYRPSQSEAEGEEPHPQAIHDAKRERREAEAADIRERNRLRGPFVKWTKWLVGIQIGLSDILIIAYVIYSYFVLHSQIEQVIVVAWLSSTVVESIGVLAVIAGGLFGSGRRHHRF